MRNTGKHEGSFLGEDGFHCSHTPTAPPVAAVPPELWLRLRNEVCAQALLWVILWEPAGNPVSAWNDSDCWLEISGKALQFFRFYRICHSLCFIHQALVQPFLGCLSFPCWSDPFQRRKHWGVTSWPSLGGFPLKKSPGEFLEQHLPPTCELLLASGIFPLFPAAVGKFLVKLDPVWVLQAD